MPRNVRNTWIETQPDDGTRSAVGTGPRTARGGQGTVVYVRHRGDVVPALRIVTQCVGAEIITTVEVLDGALPFAGPDAAPRAAVIRTER